jgi:hypothetical protein
MIDKDRIESFRNRQRLRRNVRGIAAAVLPYEASGKIDVEAFQRHLMATDQVHLTMQSIIWTPLRELYVCGQTRFGSTCIGGLRRGQLAQYGYEAIDIVKVVEDMDGHA